MFSECRNFKFFVFLLVMGLVFVQLPSSAGNISSVTGNVRKEVNQQNPSDQAPPGVTDEPQRVFAPHWTTEGGFQTTIYIRNTHIERAVSTKLSLVLAHRTIALSSIKIDPLQTITLDVAKALADNGEGAEQSGGATIEFNAGSAGQIDAYAHVLNPAGSLGFSFPFMQDLAVVPGPLEAVTWYYSGDTEASIALQNTTDKTATAVATIFISGKVAHLEKVKLQPSGITSIKIPATASFEPDGDKTLPKAAGVRIEYSGKPGSIVAQGWVMDQQIGFSMPFTFHRKASCNCANDAQHQYGTGIMIGDGGMMAPGAIFSPYLAMRNNSSKQLTISPNFSFDVAGQTQKVELPMIKLAAQQSTVLNLREFQLKNVIPIAVQMGDIDLKYQGESGALVTELASVDQLGSFVSPVPLACRGNKDMHMTFWRTDGDWHSSVTIQNLAPEENDLEITISYPEGVYVLNKKIAANTTTMLSVNELQQSQIPDEQGRLIPADAKMGGINIWSRNVKDGLVMNAMLINPVTKTCGVCGSAGYVYYVFPVEIFANNQTATGFQNHNCGEQFGLKMLLVWSSGYKSQDGCSNMHCSNTTVANMSGTNMVCYSVGVTSVTGFTSNQWPTVSDCSYFLPVYGYGPLPVVPHVNSVSPARGVRGISYDVTITGTGFSAGASVSVAGITVSNVVVGGTNEILATLNLATNTTGGDHAITVTVNGQASNTNVKFYVQIPTTIRQDSIDGITTCDPSRCQIGQQTNACGAYRMVHYTLVDQATPPHAIEQIADVTELVKDLSVPNDPGITKTVPTNEAGQFDDLLALFKTTTCPSLGESAAVSQAFTAKIDNLTFPLTRVNRIDYMKSSSGMYSIAITVQTP